MASDRGARFLVTGNRVGKRKRDEKEGRWPQTGLKRSLNHEPWTPGTASRNPPEAHAWRALFRFSIESEDDMKKLE